MGVDLGSAYGKVVIDASGAMKGVNQAKGALGGLQKATPGVMGGIASGFDKIGAGLGGVGKSLTTKVTLPMVGVATVAAKMAGDFESELNVMEVAARESTGQETRQGRRNPTMIYHFRRNVKVPKV